MNSIHPGMKLTKDFFKRIYGYEITWPGFANQALAALEAAGCSRAREYYNAFMGEYEAAQDIALKAASSWYTKQCEEQWERIRKGGERVRARQQQMRLKQARREQWTELAKALNF